MDFALSEEQEQLCRAAAEYFARETPPSFARAMLEHADGFPQEAWDSLSALGWLGIAVPESLGGSGLGLLELCVVLEEAGAVALPGPFASTVSLSLPLLLAAAAQSEARAIVPEVATGRRRVASAVAERRGVWSLDGIDATARREGGGYVLSGRKLFVPDAALADTLLVVVRLDDGAGVFALPCDMPGLAIEPMRPVDRTRRLFSVVLEEIRVEAACLLGGASVPGAALDDVLDRARVATAAGMVGEASRALAMTVEYTGLRQQFGRAIATFQAVQHRCADMKVAVEHARSLVYYAAWAADAEAADRRLAAAMAKAFASDALPAVAADAIQLHGGIGFTWEHDLHIHFKRLKADEQTYGDAIANRETVATILEERE